LSNLPRKGVEPIASSVGTPPRTLAMIPRIGSLGKLRVLHRLQRVDDYPKVKERDRWITDPAP